MGDRMESPGGGERGSDCMKRIWGWQGPNPPLTKVCFRWSLGTWGQCWAGEDSNTRVPGSSPWGREERTLR